MPLRYCPSEYQDNSEKALTLNLYEASTNDGQSVLAKWAQPVIPATQSLAQFPRRMAELICSGCGREDQSEGKMKEDLVTMFHLAHGSLFFSNLSIVDALNAKLSS